MSGFGDHCIKGGRGGGGVSFFFPQHLFFFFCYEKNGFHVQKSLNREARVSPSPTQMPGEGGENARKKKKRHGMRVKNLEREGAWPNDAFENLTYAYPADAKFYKLGRSL